MTEGSPRIVGDWGSTRLRLWLLEGDSCAGRVDGTGLFAPGTTPTETLAAALAELDPQARSGRIVLCGMAGARGGLIEAPYGKCPAAVSGWAEGAARLDFAGRQVAVLPGLLCRDANGTPDVMRGEECQVFGALALDPALASGTHICVLPGTHSKWVTLEDGAITEFATCMTGELFARLEPSSLLGGARLPEAGSGTEAEGFAAGLAAAATGALGTLAFAARTARLCDGRSLVWAQGYLSGLLIGDEIAARADDIRGRDVIVIGDSALAARYGEPIAAFGGKARLLDGEACVLQGLEAAYAQLG